MIDLSELFLHLHFKGKRRKRRETILMLQFQEKKKTQFVIRLSLYFESAFNDSLVI